MSVGSSRVRNTPYWLNFVYAGQVFEFDHIFTVPKKAAGIDGEVFLQIDILAHPAKRFMHIIGLTGTVDGGGPVHFELIEDVSLTDGTPKLAYNMDRRKTKIADTIFKTDPTNVSGGTVISSMLIATGGGGARGAGQIQTGIGEIFLNPETTYVMRLTNPDTAADSTTQIVVLFYESGN